MARFALFSPRLKALEGGYVVDSGGPTNWGITLSTLRRYRHDNTLTSSAVRALTWQQAERIYVALYWNPLRADAMVSQSIAELLVDWSINGWPGVGRIQSLLGVSVDGVWGPASLAALNAQSGPVLHAKLLALRWQYYLSLIQSNPAKYGEYRAGWAARLRAFSFNEVATTTLGVGTLLVAGLTAWGAYKLSTKTNSYNHGQEKSRR